MRESLVNTSDKRSNARQKEVCHGMLQWRGDHSHSQHSFPAETIVRFYVMSSSKDGDGQTLNP